VFDALIISDLHLGSENCQARALIRFLDDLHDGRTAARRLILNGDVFDSIDFRRLKKHHWKVLSLIRKLSDAIDIVWITGNHDGPAEVVSHLLGVEVRDELVLRTGDRYVLVHHGHRFDTFIDDHPVLTWLADSIYRVLQWMDPSHRFARAAKHTSKTFLRCAAKIEARSVEYAKKLGCDAVCCGHTHLPAARETEGVAYYNGGSWTERPCHYLAVRAGQVEVRTFVTAEAEEPALAA
jgi:UDP-2,3-diacylglucosamine pyrophosphatase LpxH